MGNNTRNYQYKITGIKFECEHPAASAYNDNIWNEVKNGTFQGFSIDGYIEKMLVKVDVKMNESKIEKLNKTIEEYEKQLSENNEKIEISVIDYVNIYLK